MLGSTSADKNKTAIRPVIGCAGPSIYTVNSAASLFSSLHMTCCSLLGPRPMRTSVWSNVYQPTTHQSGPPVVDPQRHGTRLVIIGVAQRMLPYPRALQQHTAPTSTALLSNRHAKILRHIDAATGMCIHRRRRTLGDGRSRCTHRTL